MDYDKIISEVIQIFVNNDVINEESIRNFRVKQRYEQLHGVEGMKSQDAMNAIADEFLIGLKTVEYIIYSSKR